MQGYTEEYTNIVMKSLKIAIPKIQLFFKDWITNISIEKVKKIDAFKKNIDIEKDYFITFNYTNVLENIYGVKNICHVHGNQNTDIIFGHGDLYNIKFQFSEFDKLKDKKFEVKRSLKPKKEKYYSHYLSLNDIKMAKYLLYNNECSFVQRKMIKNLKNIEEDFNFFCREENEHRTNEAYLKKSKGIEQGIMQLYLGLKKDTTTALRTVIKFLCSIKETEEIKNIFSIGFSYSDVDMKIIDIIGLLDATSWYINNYRFDNIYEYMYKIYRCTRDIDIHIFDFKSEYSLHDYL